MKLEIKANENDLSNVGCDILNHYIEYHRQKEDCFLRQCIMNSLDSKISKLLREKQKQLIWNAIGEKSYQEFMLLLASIPTIGKAVQGDAAYKRSLKPLQIFS